MTPGAVYAVAGLMLFALGLAGVVLPTSMLRRILAFNIMGSGILLALVSLAQRDGGIDPVPHAMALTGIVVALAATALALALARRLGPPADGGTGQPDD